MCMFFYEFFYEFLWPSCEFCTFFYASHDGLWWSLYVYICIYFVFRLLFRVHIIWLFLFFGFLFIFYFLFLFCYFWGGIFTCISLSRSELDDGQWREVFGAGWNWIVLYFEFLIYDEYIMYYIYNYSYNCFLWIIDWA